MGRKDERVSITLPLELKEQMILSAKTNGRSLTQEIGVAIKEYLDNHAQNNTYETASELRKDLFQKLTRQDLERIIHILAIDKTNNNE